MASTNKPIQWQGFLVPEKEPLSPPRRRGKIIGYGPRELHLREGILNTDSPEVFVQLHPQLFATGNTSRDEGYFYWAMLKVVGPEAEIGQNGVTWFYQSKVAGGHNRPGGAIVDFMVEKSGAGDDLGIRIVTPYRHTGAGPFVRAKDYEQVFSLIANDILAVDIFSVNYINDKTGKAAIMEARRAIEGRPDFSPIYHRFVGVN